MRNNRFQQFIGVFLTVLMVSYFACLSLCMHTHVVDSKFITHSHPYQSTSHSHSGAEITLFKAFSSLRAILTAENQLSEPYFVFISEVNTLISLSFEAHHLSQTSLRAPPVI